MCRPRHFLILVLGVWLGWPAPAQAHLVNSGLGPFYDGVVHMLTTPEDLLLVLVLALLAGQSGKSSGRPLLWLLPVAWGMGAVIPALPAIPLTPSLSAVVLLTLGILVASGFRLSSLSLAALGLILGLLAGMSNAGNAAWNGAMNARQGVDLVAGLGMACAVFVLVAIVGGQVAALRANWARVVVRVAGSWIGAAGILLLGWTLRA